MAGIRIAFIGKAQVVRTAASRYLKFKYHFKEKAMTDGVKELARKFYDYEAYSHVKWETRLRLYDALYSVDSNIWINYMKRRIDHMPPESNIVVDDVRYVNELEGLRKLGFIIVRLNINDANIQHINLNLLNAVSGNMIINEWYGAKADVDYTVLLDKDKWRPKKELDILMKNLTNRNSN